MSESVSRGATMTTIDLAALTDNGRVRNLTGHERGIAAREQFDLNSLDAAQEAIEVRVPDDLDAITISFFQGMFADSVRKVGSGFLEHYRFHASPEIMEQVLRGIDRVNTVRGSALG
jgi:hypothetical protein